MSEIMQAKCFNLMTVTTFTLALHQPYPHDHIIEEVRNVFIPDFFLDKFVLGMRDWCNYDEMPAEDMEDIREANEQFMDFPETEKGIGCWRLVSCFRVDEMMSMSSLVIPGIEQSQQLHSDRSIFG